MRSTLITLALLAASAAHADRLTIDPISGAAGTVATSRIVLHATGISGIQVDLTAPEGVAPVVRADGEAACVVNPGINRWDSAYALQPNGCVGDECRGVRVLIVALDPAAFTAIPDGSWLASCAWRVVEDVAAAPLGCSRAGGAPPDGSHDIPFGCEAAVRCVGDADGSGRVTVDEAVGVVGNVLEGCR